MIQYTINNNLTIKKMLDEVFVFDRSSGMIHTFNGTGGFFWERIAATTPFAEIVDGIVQEFDVSENTASSDLFDFIQQLEERQLLSTGG